MIFTEASCKLTICDVNLAVMCRQTKVGKVSVPRDMEVMDMDSGLMQVLNLSYISLVNGIKIFATF